MPLFVPLGQHDALPIDTGCQQEYIAYQNAFDSLAKHLLLLGKMDAKSAFATSFYGRETVICRTILAIQERYRRHTQA